MPRILIAECKQEVSTFNPHLSQYDDFQVRKGADFHEHHRAVRYEVGGALGVFDGVPQVEVIPAYSAIFITSGGTLAEPAWQRIANEFLDGIRCAPPVDGVSGFSRRISRVRTWNPGAATRASGEAPSRAIELEPTRGSSAAYQ
jgi:hypothetical protein